jgi:hypothetical protein
LRRLSIVAVLLIAGVMVAAPSAEAMIVIGQGVDGVKIGDTEAQVEKTIGPPGFKEHSDEHGGITIWKYPKSFSGVISFDHTGHLASMWTSSTQQRTSKGIGINSSPAEVLKAYPKTKCKLGTGPGAGPGEESMGCILKTKYHGRTVETAFEWRNKEKAMEEIDIGLA